MELKDYQNERYIGSHQKSKQYDYGRMEEVANSTQEKSRKDFTKSEFLHHQRLCAINFVFSGFPSVAWNWV